MADKTSQLFSWRNCRSVYHRGWDSLICLCFFALIAAAWIAPDGRRMQIVNTLRGPSSEHWLGTDYLGRDLLARLASSVIESLLPLWGLVLLGTAVGVSIGIGLSLAPLRSWWRPLTLLIRGTSGALSAVPFAIAAFVASAWYGQAGLASFAGLLALLFGCRGLLETSTWFARDHKLLYWQAHTTMGGSAFQRVLHYGILGSWRGDLGAMLVLHLQAALAIETSLSYLGFGVQEPASSLGNILAAHRDQLLSGDPRIPGLTMAVMAVCCAAPAAISRLGALACHHYPKHPLNPRSRG